MFLPFFFLVTSLLCVQSAPLQSNETQYDVSQFDEIHDQRQNGTENWRVNLDKILMIWSPPGGLLTAALLAEPGLLGEDFSDTEDFYKPEKPDETVVIKPEASTKPPEQNSTIESSGGDNAARRRLRVPGFLRPFVRRQPLHS